MLIKMVITLLGIHDGMPIANFNSFEIAKLQLAGLIDDDNIITPEGEVIVFEMLSLLEKVL
jgi:hypothetical protein